MEFKNLVAEGDFKITSVNLGEDHGTLNMRGQLPGFGDVWVDYTLTPGHGDDGHVRGMVTADGRALAADGTMLAGKIAAITGDDVALAGYVAENPQELKVVGSPFAIHRYGVGLPEGSPDVAVVNKILTEMIDSGAWRNSFVRYLHASGTTVPAPPVPGS